MVTGEITTEKYTTRHQYDATTLIERYAETRFFIRCSESLRAESCTPSLGKVASNPPRSRDIVVVGGGNLSFSIAAAAPTLPIRDRGTIVLEQFIGSPGQPC